MKKVDRFVVRGAKALSRFWHGRKEKKKKKDRVL